MVSMSKKRIKKSLNATGLLRALWNTRNKKNNRKKLGIFMNLTKIYFFQSIVIILLRRHKKIYTIVHFSNSVFYLIIKGEGPGGRHPSPRKKKNILNFGYLQVSTTVIFAAKDLETRRIWNATGQIKFCLPCPSVCPSETFRWKFDFLSSHSR